MQNEIKTSVVIKGYINSIVYHNEDNDYYIIKIQVSKNLITVTGVFTDLYEGLHIEIKGIEKQDPQYGLQIQALQYNTHLPKTKETMIQFLSSNFTQGIGEKFATRIVEKFGENTFNIIDESPEQLSSIPGFGKKKLKQLCQDWQRKKSLRNIFYFLFQHNITGSIAQKIIKHFGNETIEIIKKNPYCIQNKIKGIGFKRADALAMKMGVELDSAERLNAALTHVLSKNADSGHTTMEYHQLIEETKALIGVADKAIIVQIQALLKSDLITETIRTRDHNTRTFISLSKYYHMEKSIAFYCINLLRHNAPIIHFNDLNLNKMSSIKPSEEQTLAIKTGLSKRLTLITGGPGTGKSTITQVIVNTARSLNHEVVLAAPTGKASKRLYEVTQHRAQTIHQLLEFDFSEHRFRYNKTFKLDGDIFIIDEVSMVDTYLFYSLIQALPNHARLILIGDADQLPSIGPGNIINDLSHTTLFHTISLTKIVSKPIMYRIIYYDKNQFA